MTSINPQAQAAQDAARKATGEFGTQAHAESGIVPVDPKLRDWGDWEDRNDLDDADESNGPGMLVNTQVSYDPEGYAAVSVDVSSGDEYLWHVEKFLGVPLSGSEVEVQPGMTVRDGVQEWLNDGASTFIDEKLQERYSCDTSSANEYDPCPTFSWYSTEPGVLTDEQICTAAWDATVTYRNEKDPGTFNSEYPWNDWVKEAVEKFGNPLEGTVAA